MEKLFLDAVEAADLLGEGKTLFNSVTGSRNDPRFPAPIQRPGRKPKWYRYDVEAYARRVADEFRVVAPVAPCARRATAPESRPSA